LIHDLVFVIDEVAATMILSNKVSSASPYLDVVGSGINEGSMRVCCGINEGSGINEASPYLFFRSWLLACLSEEAVGWL
jgi:hypothetical protein